MTVHLDNGRIKRLTPLKNHPLGIVCPRGARAAEIVHSDDRLQYPQRRVGNRLERITWDNAFEIWIDAMRKIARKHGPEAVEGPLANPPLAKRYPLVSNSGARTQFGFRSQHYNIASLVKHQPKPLVHMHPRDADTRDIADGDPVDVVSPRGRVRFWAKVTDNIVPGAVEVNMGGGGAVGGPEWRQANVNELTDPDNYDPISGFPVFKALLCEIEKVRQSAGEGWIASFVGRDDVCSTRHGTQPA